MAWYYAIRFFITSITFKLSNTNYISLLCIIRAVIARSPSTSFRMDRLRDEAIHLDFSRAPSHSFGTGFGMTPCVRLLRNFVPRNDKSFLNALLNDRTGINRMSHFILNHGFCTNHILIRYHEGQACPAYPIV
jgi:hypothetical protein